jgi:hypothetical protein
LQTELEIPVAAPTAMMKLLDSGQAPRRKLRYTWRASQKEQLALDLRTAASTESAYAKQPELPLPPVHVVVAIEPQSVSPEGDLRYAWRVESSEIRADAQTPSQVADGMRAAVAELENLSGHAIVSARGLTTEISTAASPPTEAGAGGQMVEQVRQTLRDVAAPLPEESVGRGARWQKLSQLSTRDARITQTETFTLVELAAETGTVDDVLAQTAPAQELLAAGMPAGTHARMESMLASGDAKTRFDLSRLVPQTKFDGTTTMVVSGGTPGDTARRITMIMRVEILVSGSVR